MIGMVQIIKLKEDEVRIYSEEEFRLLNGRVRLEVMDFTIKVVVYTIIVGVWVWMGAMLVWFVKLIDK